MIQWLRFMYKREFPSVGGYFPEEGEVVMEAQYLTIRQLIGSSASDKRTYNGQWAVLLKSETEEDFYETQWAHYTTTPPYKLKTLIASFKEEREFVLSINSLSEGCRNNFIKVWVDNMPVRNSGSTTGSARFFEGASFYAKGKRVEIDAYGPCDVGKAVQGTFKFKLD